MGCSMNIPLFLTGTIALLSFNTDLQHITSMLGSARALS